MKRSTIAVGVAIVVGTGLAAASPLFPALSQAPMSAPGSPPQSPPQSPPESPPQSAPVSPATPVVTIGARATLQHNGRAVAVRVKLDCGSATSMNASVVVTVRERHGRRVLSGTERTDSVACDGSVQSFTVGARSGHFLPDVATASASASVCTTTGCMDAKASRRVHVVRAG